MKEKIIKMAETIPFEDRPISKKRLSGIANFFGLYGGEHIAATEFVIGALLVMWGVKATDIFLGLIIGNILATLTYALICAPIAVDTRLTLYSYLKKVVGEKIQKIYNFVWGIASIAMAASMMTVSASAVREVFGILPQTKWYPTDIKFILVTIVLGAIVTIVAVNGFQAVAKFSSVCAPWMVVIFFMGAVIGLHELGKITSFGEIKSLSDFMNFVNTYVWNGEVIEGGEKLSIYHVIAFAWMCNLAYHGGLNDMSLFRFAKSYKYGYISAIGMFIGHFFAWGSAGIMGATAATIAKTTILKMDSGSVTNSVLGYSGLLAVIIAGWTTANPSIYRAALALKTVFVNIDIKKLSYIVGGVMTLMACFPAVSNIMVVVNIIVLVVPAIGAICIAEHYLLPKFNGTRYWTMYKKSNLNKAALIAWGITLLFVVLVLHFKILHSYFLFLPTYLLAIVVYLILALKMGAKEDYSEEIELEEKIQEALLDMVDNDTFNEKVKKVESSLFLKRWLTISNILSLILLLLLMYFSVMVFNERLELSRFKEISFKVTIIYFILNIVTMYCKNRYGNSK